ncbi:MAG: TrkA family potassium uptake protein [bacterium]|nr:TrkA family potassium uptake protein [bacterium]
MKQFAVIGLGHFGMSVAKALIENGAQVIAIDKDEKKVADASEFVTRALELDATDEDALRDAGIQDVDAAIVGIGEDIAASILITLVLKELGIKTVISKAFVPSQGRVLQKIGANRVIYPEMEIGTKVAESLVTPEIFEYIKLSPIHTLVETAIPDSFEGKTIGELKIGTRYGVQIVGIKRSVTQIDKNGKVSFSEDIIIAPRAKDGLVKGDKLILIGENKNIEKFDKIK